MTEEDFECITNTVYKCKYCGDTFDTKENVIAHIERDKKEAKTAREYLGKYVIMYHRSAGIKYLMYIYRIEKDYGYLSKLHYVGAETNGYYISYLDHNTDTLSLNNPDCTTRIVSEKEFFDELDRAADDVRRCIANDVKGKILSENRSGMKPMTHRRIYNGTIVEDCFDCPLHSYDTCKHPVSPSEFGRRERMTWICDDGRKAVFPNDCPLKEADKEGGTE